MGRNRTGYHSTMELAVDEILAREPGNAAVAALALRGLQAGFYNPAIVDAFIQTPYGKMDIYDGYFFAQLWQKVLCGEVFHVIVGLGHEPGNDSDESGNNAKLATLGQDTFTSPDAKKPCRFHAVFAGGPGDNDGSFTWEGELSAVRLRDNVPTETVYLPGRTLSLEVGSTQITTTFLHIQRGGVARWPYGSTDIHLFINDV